MTSERWRATTLDDSLKKDAFARQFGEFGNTIADAISIIVN